MKQREEDLKWGVENTWHRINEPVGPKWHHDIVLKLASWWMWTLIHIAWQKAFCRSLFGLLLLLLSQALVPISPHHRRKSCCSCCQGTEITAVNVLPGTICAAASSMLSSLGTDRHKLIQFSNWCHRSYWWHGIWTQLYTQQQSRQQKTSSCRWFVLSNSQEFSLKYQANQLYTPAM